MSTDVMAIVGIILNTVSAVALLVTVIIMAVQIREMRRATYAAAFKAVYEMLQTDDVRNARRIVLGTLANKPVDLWADEEKRAAEKVCSSYDVVAIMVQSGMVPIDVVADSWRDSLRGTWRILSPLVKAYQVQRNSQEYWDDYEWLARQAVKHQKTFNAQE
jgi:hypothetical protein